MKLNPCLSCAYKDKNKNNPTCKQCEKRLQYVEALDKILGFSAAHSFEEPQCISRYRILEFGY